MELFEKVIECRWMGLFAWTDRIAQLYLNKHLTEAASHGVGSFAGKEEVSWVKICKKLWVKLNI